MIRVTIEEVPFGLESNKQTIGTLKIINNLSSEDWKTGNYDVECIFADNDVYVLENAVVDHQRSQGALQLIFKSIKALINKGVN